ncbi:MAG: hypothetical protein P9L99_06840 [Candidatus Lernaella stagnicola]|nr:hypothetical protein [Candidatus Lernaella stagnicola]
MKWWKSFLLHPWINRFNLLYLAAGFALYLLDPLDAVGINNFGWMLLGGEIAYLAARGVLDRGSSPDFNIRKMRPKDRDRYFRLLDISDQAIADIESNQNIVHSVLSGSQSQIRRMVKTFLRLQLAAHRIDAVLQNNKIDYNAEIGRVQGKLSVAAAAEKPYLERQIEVLRKRQNAQRDLAERRRTIDARLETIEQAVGLLSEIGLGVADPAETADQVSVILANVEDAELFVEELNEVMAPVSVKNAN